MKKALPILSLVFLTLLIAFKPADLPPGYKIGDTAMDFKLKNVDGKSYALADLKETKGYVVVFTCNNCPYAKAYEDRIIALHQKYAAQGYPVVAINPNDKTVQPLDSYDNMKKRAKEKNFPYLYLYDESQEVAKTYGAVRTPHVFLLDKDKKVRYIGAIDDNSDEPENVKEKYLENAIEALKSGQEVAVKETKALGCGIKWKRAE